MRTSVLLAALAATAACGGDPPRRSALLVTLDTTRADALGCYGGRPEVTPHLDALARESVRFDDARTVAPITLPAHASMLTGLYPPRHGVRGNAFGVLVPEAVTVAELAGGSGVQTAAFVASAVLDRSFGAAQGFAEYGQPRREAQAGLHGAELPAGRVIDAALAWLAARDRGRPFLLWVHLYDPHDPYQPPAEARARGGGDPYLGEVAAMDAELGRLLDALRAEGALDETLVVVVGDHGEARGEHGEATHSALCFDATLRVPLLVRDPDGRGAGTACAAPASVADVAPTLLEGLGLDVPAGLDGVSLYRREPPDRRGVYFESYYGWLHYGWAPLAGWADARGKYVHAPAPRFYELASDPGEARPLPAATRADVAPYREALRRVADAPALAPQSGGAPGPGLDADLMAQLVELGYATAGAVAGAEVPHPLAHVDAPDPHERVGELQRLDDARRRTTAGDWDGAIAVLAPLVRESPRNAAALELLSVALIVTGRCAEAIPHLEAVLALGERASALLNLGFCLQEAGRDREAADCFARALELDPGNETARHNLQVVRERLGE